MTASETPATTSTDTPTPTIALTPTVTPTTTLTITPTPTIAQTPTLSPTPAVTLTATVTPTTTSTITPTPTITQTPTLTPTPAATPAATAAATACPDYDGDTLCDDVDPDDDNDGCTDAAELQPSSAATSGGGRDPNYFWDVMDVPVGVPPIRDKAIRVGDIGGVVARFGATREPPLSKAEAFAEALTPPPPAPAYHAAFDRGSPIPGQNLWNLLPPDGIISIVDIGGVVAQFGHSCA